MFHRVILDAWQHIVPYIAFGITFTVFMLSFIRAMLMKKDTATNLAAIPLDDIAPNQEGNGIAKSKTSEA